MIPLLLAQTPAPEALKSWLETFFWLGGGMLMSILIWKHLTGKSNTAAVGPQPFIVKGADDFATKPELAGLAKKMDDELGRERGARKKIHEEISELQGDMKGLKITSDHQTRQLSNLDGKMDQVLLRLPRPPKS